MGTLAFEIWYTLGMDFLSALIRLGTAVIPVKSVRKRLRRRGLDWIRRAEIAKVVPVVRVRYARHLVACRAKRARGERLRVCFLVCDAAMFSAEPIYQALLGDARFEPFIAVVPRVSRGEAFLRETLQKTLDTLRSRYGESVVSLYDVDTRTCSSLENRADIVFTSIVYDGQTLACYTAEPLSRFALVVCIPYGYSGPLAADTRRQVFLPQLAFFWKHFVATPFTAEAWCRANPMLAYNVVSGGYPKMDRLASVPIVANRPKTILVCPHHSLGHDGAGVALSNFLRYAEFFQTLPNLFPDVRFVFRPHPLLIPRLREKRWWGEEKTAEYVNRMKSHANVEYQDGGDYFASFVNSDALIHDCGSFFGEWFYTGKPQCYLLANKDVVDREFTSFGKRLHDFVYPAFTEDDIVAFIREVVLDGQDVKKDARTAFAAREVCLFHPHAAQRIVEKLTEVL